MSIVSDPVDYIKTFVRSEHVAPNLRGLEVGSGVSECSPVLRGGAS